MPTSTDEKSLRFLLTPGYCNLLHKSHIRRGPALRRLFDRPELGFIPVQILPERSPDAFGVPRADDRAAQELPLRTVRKDIDKIEREFFQVVMNHHEVAVLPLQFLLICLDLHLSLRRLLLIHLIRSRNAASNLP